MAHSPLRSFTRSLIHSSIPPFIHSSAHPFTYSFTPSFIHCSSIHFFTQSLIHSSIPPFTHSFAHPFAHSFTHSLLYSFIHSFKAVWSLRVADTVPAEPPRLRWELPGRKEVRECPPQGHSAVFHSEGNSARFGVSLLSHPLGI